VLCGVNIPYPLGLLGYSDADVCLHALSDAILGAAAPATSAALPDTDRSWKNANSIDLLHRAATIVRAAGFTVANVDVVVIAERPKLLPHVDAMRTTLSRALGCEPTLVSVKGKTNEGVDSTGAGESIAVHAVALLSHVGRVLLDPPK
jgi:2-C-methyl-D-erythritol 2,4-cyclodiphosphate synthase